MNINSADFETLKTYYDTVLNKDKSTHRTANDVATPIGCVSEMIAQVPPAFWSTPGLRILDPCCGNGNFGLVLYNELIKHHPKADVLEAILTFNDVNEQRLANVREVFCADTYRLKLHCEDFMTFAAPELYDAIVANPPYAKLLANGQRASKNHNLIKDFIEKALSMLKPDGYLVFLTPDNWMSFADRNTLIRRLTELQIHYLDIHGAKKYFTGVGSSFTWYIIQNRSHYKDMVVASTWKKKITCGPVASGVRNYIPLLYNQTVKSILDKTVDDTGYPRFEIKTSSYLHKYTKASFIQDNPDEVYKYRLIHTPKKTVYASKPHVYQEGFKVFISTTDKYAVFVDNCGMTQSIVFILCENEAEAQAIAQQLMHPLYVFLNNICRWGNFNNIRILQSFPKPVGQPADLYSYFQISETEKNYIADML